jgi:peptidoglycan/LPS O-acetylase OafA/YrhL
LKEIRTLTGLRGVAALWVVALHYTRGAGWIGTGFWFTLAAAGMEGVIIFFLLSGYILNHVYGSISIRSYWAFMWARLARVYPLHLATLLAWGVLLLRGYVLQNPDDNEFTFVLNIFLVQAWGFWDLLSWNRLSWTISVEMLCYLLFPFVAYWLGRRSIPTCMLILGLSIWAVAEVPHNHVMELFGIVRDQGKPLSYGFFLGHFCWLFLGGMALQRVTQWLQYFNPNQRFFDSLLIIGFCAIVYKATTPPVYDWSIALGGALVIMGLANDRGLGRILFGNPLVFFLGEISYALYLTHGMVHVIFEHRFPSVPAWGIAVAAICVAAPTYYLFERPARKMLRNLVARREVSVEATVSG